MDNVVLMNQLPDYIREHIAFETDGKLRCPKCDGGRTGEISLSVYGADSGEGRKMSGAIRLHCWRASCGWTAVTLSSMSEVKMQSGKIKPPKVYRDPLSNIKGMQVQELRFIYGLKQSSYVPHGWKVGEDEALVMPILCPVGGVRGHATRTFTKPKRCYTYKATAQPWLDWWTGDRDGPLVIVEDTLSACRLSGLEIQAVALLGTGMTVEQAQEIKAYSSANSCVYLALDRDAFNKAIHMRRRHKHILDLRPICLMEDIKNIPEDRTVRSLFKE